MKKNLLLVAAMLLMSTVAAFAQPRAVGLRLGYGVEASYQHSLGASNMINLDAGVPGFAGVEAACTYDWINPGGVTIPWDKKGEWNWYAGVGAGLGWYWTGDGAMSVGAAGRIGVEYNFWFPLQLSVDWRPMVGPYFGFNGGGVGFNIAGLYAGAIALGVRYKF
ncbi:MAG: hypothetical protein MJ003_04470 [Paludibacteraceae bacterium]|nr:hypothetical protein [Paludibacteraceae bacterium]